MEQRKQCFKCGEVKPLPAFYKHPKMADGHVNKCKECNKRDVKENRKKKVDYYREYDRDRGNRHKDGYVSKWRERYPNKRRAHDAISYAVSSGKMKKPENCQECGESEFGIHGHHDDYLKPLDVRWLCPSCHSYWHRKNGEGHNAN